MPAPAPIMPFEGECNIRKVGISEAGKLRIELQDASSPARFGFTWYGAPDALQREHLSMALTAITANKRVFCKLRNPGQDNDTVLYFGVTKG